MDREKYIERIPPKNENYFSLYSPIFKTRGFEFTLSRCCASCEDLGNVSPVELGGPTDFLVPRLR